MDRASADRRLAAVLAADVAGYTRLMEADAAGTLAELMRQRAAITAVVEAHGGRIANTAGDSLLIEFGSAADAFECAIAIQRAAGDDGGERRVPERALRFRIGVHLGDVLARDGDLFGDPVNIAARLEAIAEAGGIVVSEAVYQQVRRSLDVGFEDLGRQALKNVSEDMRTFRVLPEGAAPTGPAPAEGRPSLAPPDKPSLAVLPFVDLGSDPSQDYFADGVVEEITAALSRMRSLFVIARNSTLAYRGRGASVAQIGRELGVHYLIEGSVRRAGERVRIAAQLVDVASGNQIWAERYDGQLADIFDLQDRIAGSVAGAIQPSILGAEIERARRKRPESLVAYDYVLRAFPLVWSLDRAQNEAAAGLLGRAIAIEPTYPLALSLLAWCHAQRAVYNWSDRPAEARREALRLAQQAAALSAEDPTVLAILGAAHTVARDFDSAAVHLARAVALDPNSAWAWQRTGWLDVNCERPDEAIAHFERAMRLSPVDPMGFIADFGIGAAHFVAGRYAEAVIWTQKGLSRQPHATWSLRVLVPALAHAGRLEEARQSLARLLESHPGLTIAKVRESLSFGPGTMERIAGGLRKAGLAE
ncbi:MAG: adenylate/guanylate cyclase domain-containing protein [Dongiaceae bacterium]